MKEEKNMKLYIIGNGFDLHYGLNTKTSDFTSYLCRERIYNSLANASDEFLCCGVNWSEYEEDIANINLDVIEETQLQYPDYMSDHESDRDGVILNMDMYLDSLSAAVFSSLKNMANDANKVCLAKDFEFESDFIVNFNYTNTVEKVSKTVLDRPVFHIHGAVEHNIPLVFGYGRAVAEYDSDKYSRSEDGDYYLEKQAHLIEDFYLSFQKDLKIKDLRRYIESINQTIDCVEVRGHSIGSVDMPYFELIEELLAPKKWRISYHEDGDPVIENVNNLSFCGKVDWFKW